MRTVWKYTLGQRAVKVMIWMPRNSHPLHVGEQDGQITLWMEVPRDETQQVQRTFEVIGTGWDVPFGHSHHIGTAMLPPYVWHVYETTPMADMLNDTFTAEDR